MGSLIWVGLIAAGLVALTVPWVGVAASYLIALLNPQVIWFWSFEGTRLVFWISIVTLVGVTIKGIKGELNYRALQNSRTFFLVLLLLTCIISALFAPYSGVDESRRLGSASFILENLSKILLTLFVGSIVVSTARELKAFAWMYAAVGMYLTYWINDRYLSGAAFGRVAGPRDLNGIGAYADENVFSALFVTAIPFMFYLALKIKRKLLRYGMLLFIPLAWHAVFLTGSRGGMLALAASTVLLAVRTRNRSMGALVVVGLIVAFVWQGGSVLQSRMETLSAYEEDDSANDRVNAWKAAVSMIEANPLTGVGPGAFVRAFPDYSDKRPAQAHNTLLQFAAEFGVLAGLAFVGMFVSSVSALWRCAGKLREMGGDASEILMLVEATIIAQFGCAVASIFLSFQLFEPLYFLMFFANVSIGIAQKIITAQKPMLSPGIATGHLNERFSGRGMSFSSDGVFINNERDSDNNDSKAYSPNKFKKQV
jgi:putative inorganic carbon (HCO3(-)) transporter